MQFRIGQKVKVINNSNMSASLEATAIVTEANYVWHNYNLVGVQWLTKANRQMNGAYELYHFEPLAKKNEQLLFNFIV